MTESDHQQEMIRLAIESHLQVLGIELSDNQKERAFNGVEYWLNETLPDAIKESVSNVTLQKKEK